MLSLFEKHKNNSILKLFRVVTASEARHFNVKYFIDTVLEQLESFLGDPPSDYYITGPYPDKGWKTKNGFLKALKSKNYQDVCHLLLSTGSYSFSFENWSLNELQPKKIDNQVIIFSIREETADLVMLERFSLNLFKSFPFQYGYLLSLPNNYIPLTERKKDKGVFTKKDIAWNESISRIANGLIKGIYPINFIQERLVNNPTFKERVLDNRLGAITKLDIGLYKWALSDQEAKKAKQLLNGANHILAETYT